MIRERRLGEIVSRSRVMGGISLGRSAEQVSGERNSEKDEQDYDVCAEDDCLRPYIGARSSQELARVLVGIVAEVRVC